MLLKRGTGAGEWGGGMPRKRIIGRKADVNLSPISNPSPSLCPVLIFPLFCLLPVHFPCVSDIQLNAVLLSSVDKNEKDFFLQVLIEAENFAMGIFFLGRTLSVFFQVKMLLHF